MALATPEPTPEILAGRIDTFDPADAPRHEADTFDPAAHVAALTEKEAE